MRPELKALWDKIKVGDEVWKLQGCGSAPWIVTQIKDGTVYAKKVGGRIVRSVEPDFVSAIKPAA